MEAKQRKIKLMIRQIKMNQMTTPQTMGTPGMRMSPQVEALLQRYRMILGQPSPSFQVLLELPNPELRVLNQEQILGLSAPTIKGHSVGMAQKVEDADIVIPNHAKSLYAMVLIY